MHLITLTTDFGSRDWFVGTMKGVILGIHPRASVVDLTHEIPPGDIRAGAFALAAASRFFPRGTVHVAVIDPGVGGSRRAIAAQTADGFWVGPDNGVLSWALEKAGIQAVHALENEKFFVRPVSRTFHGRDIFAPVAAHLSRGRPIGQVGPALDGFVRLPWPKLVAQRDGVRGEVMYIDRFGNGITNLDAAALHGLGGTSAQVLLKRKPVCFVVPYYQAVPSGRPAAVLGSSGFLEIAVNQGSAARDLGLRVGDSVSLRRP